MEIWKDIPGYEGRYQVSDLGRVRSQERYARCVSKSGREFWVFRPGKILKPGSCRGYLIVNPWPRPTIAVHLLVARTFVPGCAGNLQVNHIDGDKRNNRADNLEWVTVRENHRHAVRLGLNTQAIPVTSPTTGMSYPSIAEATRFEGKPAREWPRA